MQFRKIQLAPGINRESTRYSNSGGWWDCDKIRFRNGLPEKIGGWTRYTTSQFDGTCRHMNNFRLLNGVIHTLIGTDTRLYMEWGQDLFELTPWIDRDLSLSNPFTTTNTESDVQVTKVSHGLEVGDRIEISGASDTNGILAAELNGVRDVSEIVDTDNYKFTSGGTATSSGTGGGTVDIYYLYPDGLDSQISGDGWGRSTWGSGAWGAPVSGFTLAANQLRTWSSDTFGEDLFICSYDDKLFYWDATNGIESTPTSRPMPLDQVSGSTSAPTLARIAMVSQRSRHAIAFACDPIDNIGVQDPLLIRWSDSEDISDWDETSTINTAGSLILGTGSEIITAEKGRNEILVWTDSDLHSLQYIGGDLIYGVYLIARNTSIIGRNAAAVHLGVAYWMGQGAFYIYDGQVRELPCSVADYVFQDINLLDDNKIFASTYADEGEIVWFYPSANSEENDRYVIFNTIEGVWYFGNMARTAHMDATLYSNPLAASTDNYLYAHEDGVVDGSDNSQIIAHIESSPLEIQEGYQFSFIDRVIPDVTFRDVSSGVVPSATMTIKAYRNPGSSLIENDNEDVTRTATSPIEQFTEDVWVRLRGRAITFRIEDTSDSNNKSFGWRLGTPRLSIRTDGRR